MLDKILGSIMKKLWDIFVISSVPILITNVDITRGMNIKRKILEKTSLIKGSNNSAKLNVFSYSQNFS